MSQATLKTDRLLLVPLSEEHLEDEVELDSDPEVMRFLGSGRSRTRDEVEQLHLGRLLPLIAYGAWASGPGSSIASSSAGASSNRRSVPIRAR